jgi:hypothetical protein
MRRSNARHMRAVRADVVPPPSARDTDVPAVVHDAHLDGRIGLWGVRVYADLAQWDPRDGQPTQKLLAERLKLRYGAGSVRTVRRAIADLVVAGLVAKRNGHGHRHEANEYALLASRPDRAAIRHGSFQGARSGLLRTLTPALSESGTVGTKGGSSYYDPDLGEETKGVETDADVTDRLLASLSSSSKKSRASSFVAPLGATP